MNKSENIDNLEAQAAILTRMEKQRTNSSSSQTEAVASSDAVEPVSIGQEAQNATREGQQNQKQAATITEAIARGFKGIGGHLLQTGSSKGKSSQEVDTKEAAGQAAGGPLYSAGKELYGAAQDIKEKANDESTLLGKIVAKVKGATGAGSVHIPTAEAKPASARERDENGRFIGSDKSVTTSDSVVTILKSSDGKEDKRHKELLAAVKSIGVKEGPKTSGSQGMPRVKRTGPGSSRKPEKTPKEKPNLKNVLKRGPDGKIAIRPKAAGGGNGGNGGSGGGGLAGMAVSGLTSLGALSGGGAMMGAATLGAGAAAAFGVYDTIKAATTGRSTSNDAARSLGLVKSKEDIANDTDSRSNLNPLKWAGMGLDKTMEGAAAVTNWATGNTAQKSQYTPEQEKEIYAKSAAVRAQKATGTVPETSGAVIASVPQVQSSDKKSGAASSLLADSMKKSAVATTAATASTQKMSETMATSGNVVTDWFTKIAANNPVSNAVNAAGSAYSQSRERGGGVWDSLKAGVSGAYQGVTGKTKEREANISAAADRAGITDPKEKAAFMGQMNHESAGFTAKSEGNYSPDAVWKLRGGQLAKQGISKDQVDAAYASGGSGAMDEMMYGGRMGNTQPGDATKYKGKGATQLTGKDNYADMTKRLQAKGINVDLVKNPELAADPRYEGDIATEFWKKSGAGAAARKGDQAGVDQAINGGTYGNANGKADRAAKTQYYANKIAKEGGVTPPVAPLVPGTPEFASKQAEMQAKFIADQQAVPLSPASSGPGSAPGRKTAKNKSIGRPVNVAKREEPKQIGERPGATTEDVKKAESKTTDEKKPEEKKAEVQTGGGQKTAEAASEPSITTVQQPSGAPTTSQQSQPVVPGQQQAANTTAVEVTAAAPATVPALSRREQEAQKIATEQQGKPTYQDKADTIEAKRADAVAKINDDATLSSDQKKQKKAEARAAATKETEALKAEDLDNNDKINARLETADKADAEAKASTSVTPADAVAVPAKDAEQAQQGKPAEGQPTAQATTATLPEVASSLPATPAPITAPPPVLDAVATQRSLSDAVNSGNKENAGRIAEAKAAKSVKDTKLQDITDREAAANSELEAKGASDADFNATRDKFQAEREALKKPEAAEAVATPAGSSTTPEAQAKSAQVGNPQTAVPVTAVASAPPPVIPAPAPIQPPPPAPVTANVPEVSQLAAAMQNQQQAGNKQPDSTSTVTQSSIKTEFDDTMLTLMAYDRI